MQIMFYCSLMIALLCGLSVADYPTCLGIYVIYMHDMLYICTLQLYDCVYICMYTLCLLIWKPYLSHFELGMRAHIFKTIMHAIYIN